MDRKWTWSVTAFRVWGRATGAGSGRFACFDFPVAAKEGALGLLVSFPRYGERDSPDVDD